MDDVEQTTYRRYRFNVKQYYALAEAGILRPDEHVELLDGRITNKWPVPGQPCPPDACVEVYSKPTPEGYQKSERPTPGQTLDVPAFPDLSLSVDDVLG